MKTGTYIIGSSKFNIVMSALFLLVGAAGFALNIKDFFSTAIALYGVLIFFLIVHLFFSIRTKIYCGVEEFAVRHVFSGRKKYNYTDIRKIIVSPWYITLLMNKKTLRIYAIGMTGINQFVNITKVPDVVYKNI